MPGDLSPFNLVGISTLDKETLSLSTGDITPVRKFVIVAAETGTTDDLDGIIMTGVLSPGDADGAEILLMADAGDTITIRHNQNAAAAKNVLTEDGANIVMTGNMVVRLVYNIALDTNGASVVSAVHASDHAARHADGGADELAVQDFASDAATDGQVVKADGAGAVAFEDDIKGLQFIIDGGGSVILTGVKGTIIVPFACEITAWNIVGDLSGSINVDVNRSAWNTTPSYSSIAASAHPALSSAIAAEDTTLTGWTKTLAARDILQFEVDSIATCTRATLLITVKRT